MTHLTDNTLTTHAIDAAELTIAEQEHLVACHQCQAALQALVQLAEELALAKQSRPNQERLTTYYDLFAAATTEQTNWRDRVLATLKGVLTVDGRTHAAQGVRRSAATAYRMLFSTEWADVELLIDAAAGPIRIEGELLPLQTEEAPPALIQLVALTPAGETASDYAAESDTDGHFQFDGVQPGRYRLLITPAAGPALDIDELTVP